MSALLAGSSDALPPNLAAELATARAVRAGLPPVPAGARFDADLARRLFAHRSADGTARLDDRLTGFVKHHQRLVLTGALGSVVVSTASVAVVAWRMVHRTP